MNVLRALEYAQGPQRLRQAAAGARGQPQPRLRVRPQVVRLRPEPHLRRGRPPGPLGVVVVVAAGNTGYGSLTALARQTNVGLTMTINDPGNAALAITVGATHRDMPHTYGVSYFLQGPHRRRPAQAGPGRPRRADHRRAAGKAPDQRVPRRQGTSGRPGGGVRRGLRHQHGRPPRVRGGGQLPVHPARVHRPARGGQADLPGVRHLLGRERYFQGHGLVDLMRAIQSI